MRHIEDKLEFLKKNSKSIGKSWGYYNYDQSKKNWKVERERMHRRAAAEAGISQGLPSDLDEEEENPPDWADHLFRTAYGPLGGTANIDRSEPDQLVRPARSFSRTATETYIAKHGEEHPHNTTTPHGHFEHLHDERHGTDRTPYTNPKSRFNKRSPPSLPGTRFTFAKTYRAPGVGGTNQTRGSFCIASGRPTPQKKRDSKIIEMMTELQVRCNLTNAQLNALSLQLVSHVSRDEPHVKFERFVEIAKSIGLERPDMEFYKKMYHVLDTNDSNSVDFEELCVGLAFFGQQSCRSKLRMLYQTWSLNYASGQDVDHQGHFEVGLTKFDIFTLIATLIGSSHEIGSKLAGRDMNELFRQDDPESPTKGRSPRGRPSTPDESDEHDPAATAKLLQAINADDPDQIRALIAAGANLSEQIGEDGQTFLQWAKDTQKEKAQRAISEYFYKELKEKRDALAKHARRGAIVIAEAIKRLLRHGFHFGQLPPDCKAAKRKGARSLEGPEPDESNVTRHLFVGAGEAAVFTASPTNVSKHPTTSLLIHHSVDEWGFAMSELLDTLLFTPLDPQAVGSITLEQWARAIGTNHQADMLRTFLTDIQFPTKAQALLNLEDQRHVYGQFFKLGKIQRRAWTSAKLSSAAAAANGEAIPRRERKAAMEDIAGELPTLEVYKATVDKFRHVPGGDTSHTSLPYDARAPRRMRITWRDEHHCRRSDWRRSEQWQQARHSQHLEPLPAGKTHHHDVA
jgi:hypothetical protein